MWYLCWMSETKPTSQGECPILKEQGIAKDSSSLRSTQYFLLALVVIISLVLLVTGVSILIEQTQLAIRPLWIVSTLIILAICSIPLSNYLRRVLSRANYGHQRIQQENLAVFKQELIQLFELPNSIEKLDKHLTSGLNPSSQYIFLLDPVSELYICATDQTKNPATDLRFPANSSLVLSIGELRHPIVNDRDFQKQLSHSDKSRLALLGTQIISPLHGEHGMLGWVAIGASMTNRSYSASDLSYLATLCQDGSIAIEHSQLIIGLQQRVRDMDVLSRVAQGVNITPDFDDILELVYTQTSQAIVCDDFHISLRNLANGSLYHAFYLENNERSSLKENVSLPAGYGLEEVVSHSQHSLITGDYYQECILRQVRPDSREIYAWMGVPLNAGADTIGAIGLGCRDPLQVYTNQQLNLLQSIADQAAGAIVKTRLINVTEQRAKQLNMLNEISRSLTSTLEIRPLLDQILNSATEILYCDAGSLFMIDESSGELVFEVTAGPVADNLVGMRLPPGTGIVGKSVNNAQPIIANDVQHFENWSDTTDKQTGFVTKDLLVVPMQVKDKIIGVIEIINKKDGSPFTLVDQELLATFASQAAIAIDNARLYTQTDQALSARVEELSVMQRIDRELNASLELDRVLRIALEWSMKQSRADAGIVGLISKNENDNGCTIRVMASMGINENTIGEITSEAGFILPDRIARSPIMDQAFEQAAPKLSESITLAEDGSSSKGAGIIIVPIHRRNEPIGVLLLERYGKEPFADETIAFLSRLSDHAAIAISNAQLYADLQSANIAKTEFVSLVSHELKTPMTSIKGYADLLAKGAVGPINDAQSNFLNTIRSNVSRMATLVSDLSDISRIEAGRMRLEYSSVPINDSIMEVVRSAQTQINEKKQTIELQLSEENPNAWCDPTRLTQILANLVSNAIKYTPNDGTITISEQRAQNIWDPKGAPNVICVRVTDTGYGISPDDQKKIFQKFFRSEDQNIREAPGTGLGLNITRHLVEMQGGRIWLESQIGKGTSFYFTIPISSTTQ
jgi:signal transduction histidine kinase